MKRFIFGVISIFVLFGPVGLTHAVQVTLAWDPNAETDLAGYKVYYGHASGGPYTGASALEGPSPVSLPLENLPDRNNPQITLSGLPDSDIVFAVTAYNTANQESDYSNEVGVDMPEIIPLDQAYSVSNGIIDQANGLVTFNVSSSNLAGYFLKRSNLTVNKGQTIVIEFDGYYSGSYPDTPLSVKTFDLYGDISRESWPFLNGGYGHHVIRMPAKDTSSIADVMLYTGALPGIVQLQRISIRVENPVVPAVEDVYLEGLAPSPSGGKFAAVFRIVSSEAVNGRIVRIAKTIWDIEAGDSLLAEETLEPDELTFMVDIGSALYDDPVTADVFFYQPVIISVENVINGIKSEKVKYAYLPGDIIKHQDETSPTPSLLLAVTAEDYNWVYSHRLNQIVPALDGTPACYWRRADNKADKLINTYDLSFVSLQRARQAKMIWKIYP